MKKAAKAQWYARNEGFVYGEDPKLVPAELDHPGRLGFRGAATAVDCGFFPLYEVERGKTVITYDPEALGRKRPIRDWLGEMGKTKHLMTPGSDTMVDTFSEEVERRWRRLKAKHGQTPNS